MEDTLKTSPPAPQEPKPTPQPAPVTSPSPLAQTPTPPSGLPAFMWNKRTQNIAIWSVVASIALAYITQVGAYLSARFFVGGILDAVDPTGTLGGFINATAPIIGFDFGTPLKNGIVSGLITAAVLYFLYQRIFEWVQKKSWGKHLNTFFKLMFYPYLAGTVLATLLGSLASLMGALIMLIFSIAGHYAYAKLLDMKIGHYFSNR